MRWLLGCTEKTPHASKLMIRILVGDQNPKERKKMVKWFFILVKSFHCCKSADSLHWVAAGPVIVFPSLVSFLPDCCYELGVCLASYSGSYIINLSLISNCICLNRLFLIGSTSSRWTLTLNSLPSYSFPISLCSPLQFQISIYALISCFSSVQ